MKRTIIKSGDGSHTLYVPEMDEHYHSHKGALRESEHVFIRSGLFACNRKHLNILEIGFGTGLNAFLSLIAAIENKIRIEYTTIEKYPLHEEEWQSLNFVDFTPEKFKPYFYKLHESMWDIKSTIHENFLLLKIKKDLHDINYSSSYDLVYFDAFAPDVQPDLWSAGIFSDIYGAMNPGGILVTYSVKGSVRRTLEECGFGTERLPGPPGKRQILRAIK